MAVNDLFNDGFDADESRYNRQNRLNPPEFPPGQDMSMPNDIFSTSSVPADNSMGDIFSAAPTTGGTDIFGNPIGGMPQNQQGQNKDASDMFWDMMSKCGKGIFDFAKDLTSSMSGLTPLFWNKYGAKVTVISTVFIVIGLIGRLFGLDFGLELSIGGCLTGAVGIVVYMFTTEKSRQCTSQYEEENNTLQSMTEPEPSFSMDGNEGFSFNDFGEDTDGFNSESEDEDDDFGDDYSDDWDFSDVGVSAEPSEGMSADEALSTLKDIPTGMYTRQYLYDMFTKVLPTMKPDFATIRDIDEDDDKFLEWGDSLRDAASVAGCKEDYLPELLSLQENLFTIILTCDRPQGFKPDVVANELANIYAYQGGTFNKSVYAKADTVGRECIITIFTGKTAMISLKDMMLQAEDYILDSSNYIPVIFGIDQLGNVIKYDFKKLESIIITGMPRSGKSWLVQAVLTQMCAFVSPKELNILICDPKEGISDFKSFTLPHVKKFVSGDSNIVKTLSDLVKVEGPRRKKIIGDAGFVNIWDFKERYPDVKLPVIYVVVDEVVTLASRMDKETNVEFRMLLRELISQLPALGIRAFLIPHVLNNDIIEKKTSDLVPCKISVCGDADHIEKATGSKPKEFPYRLTNKGDMAVKIPAVSPETLFIHGAALTSSNPKNNELFDYLRRVWSTLEPDEVKGSVAIEADANSYNSKLLDKLKTDDITESFTDFGNDEDDIPDLFDF